MSLVGRREIHLSSDPKREELYSLRSRLWEAEEELRLIEKSRNRMDD